MPYDDFARIAGTLEAQDWIFAKTMPQNPHYYALRKNFKDDALFDSIVDAMRGYSYSGKWGGRNYQYFNVNNHYYWTMGAPIPKTVLINRKDRGPAPYDEIALRYDELFTDTESRHENEDVLAMIDYRGGSLLEIGCASCPLVAQISIDRYCGIDPSPKMTEICREKYPGERFIQSDFESFYDGQRYDYIAATFGAASYIHSGYLSWIHERLNPEGKFFLMFYKDEYTPATYRKTGIFLDWYKGNYKAIPGDLSEYHNYIVLKR
jgi:hypothetical protein